MLVGTTRLVSSSRRLGATTGATRRRGDAEEDRSEVDRARMRRGPATCTPAPTNQKANTAAETAEKLLEIPNGIHVFTDGGCDGTEKCGYWGACGWGAHVQEVMPNADANGDINVTADFGADKGTNNTGELNGMGQGLLYLWDFDGTDDAVVFMYDSMYAANMVQGF